jgi:hypothetical protein
MLALYSLLPLLALCGAAPTALQKRYSGVRIRSGRDGLCLAAEPKTGKGSGIVTVDCASSGFPTKWDISPGSGSVLLSGSGLTDLALDAGEGPHNNAGLTVQESQPGLTQQT